MKVIQTEIPDVLVMEPQVFEDEPGFFYESYEEPILSAKDRAAQRFKEAEVFA